MTDHEYILVSNRVKVSAALQILRDITPGAPYGVKKNVYRQVIATLTTIEDHLSSPEQHNSRPHR